MKQQAESGANHGTLATYVTGFALSIVLTFLAYLAVTQPLLPKADMVAAIVVFGFLQLLVQLVFFLHLDRESSPRWNLMVFGFAVLVVGIVMGGSLWIMQNLNYKTMSPASIMKDERIVK